MEGRKQSGSSLASDLFGEKDSSLAAASSSGVFGSIFAPPPKVLGSEIEKKNNPGNQAWSAKAGVSDKNAVGGACVFPDKNVVSGEGQNQNAANKDTSSYYTEEKTQPFHYSSSIYYGGQDVYSRPQNAQNLTTFNKDAGEDDSNSASRGNWWQGSLYY